MTEKNMDEKEIKPIWSNDKYTIYDNGEIRYHYAALTDYKSSIVYLGEQLRTVTEQNKKLDYIIDKQDRQLNDEMKINLSLTEQLSIAEEALESIQQGDAGFQLCGHCDKYLPNLATQALAKIEEIGK